jgi:hypothetical protein
MWETMTWNARRLSNLLRLCNRVSSDVPASEFRLILDVHNWLLRFFPLEKLEQSGTKIGSYQLTSES